MIGPSSAAVGEASSTVPDWRGRPPVKVLAPDRVRTPLVFASKKAPAPVISPATVTLVASSNTTVPPFVIDVGVNDPAKVSWPLSTLTLAEPDETISPLAVSEDIDAAA